MQYNLRVKVLSMLTAYRFFKGIISKAYVHSYKQSVKTSSSSTLVFWCIQFCDCTVPVDLLDESKSMGRDLQTHAVHAPWCFRWDIKIPQKPLCFLSHHCGMHREGGAQKQRTFSMMNQMGGQPFELATWCC